MSNIEELTNRFHTFHDALLDRIEFDYRDGHYCVSKGCSVEVHISLKAFDYRFLNHHQFPEKWCYVELFLGQVKEFNLRAGNWIFDRFFELHFVKTNDGYCLLTDAEIDDDKDSPDSDDFYFKFKELRWEVKDSQP